MCDEPLDKWGKVACHLVKFSKNEKCVKFMNMEWLDDIIDWISGHDPEDDVTDDAEWDPVDE